jgi:hypothetical protein
LGSKASSFAEVPSGCRLKALQVVELPDLDAVHRAEAWWIMRLKLAHHPLVNRIAPKFGTDAIWRPEKYIGEAMLWAADAGLWVDAKRDISRL